MTGPAVAVAAPHPAALDAARAASLAGGNALDVALAAATALAVAYPHQCSLGGDLVALVREPSGGVRAIVSAGAAPARVDVEALRAAGDGMPRGGPHSVTVPGVLAGWAAVAGAGARLALADHLLAAAELAEAGVTVAPGLAEAIVERRDVLAADPGARDLLLPGGRPLAAGAPLVQPRLAATLRTIAEDGPAALYGGSVGAALAEGLAALGAAMRVDDLAAHEAEVVPALTARALGATWHVAPPPTQGATLLAMLDGLDRGGLTLHRTRAAVAARDRHLGDPRQGPIDVAALRHALAPAVAGSGSVRAAGDTVAVAAIDAEGRAVALIQSVFQHFGSGILEPATGIVLHNRGSAFSLEEGHPGALAPGARPPHTLCPVVVETGDAVVAAGCQGGRAQPQILAQLAADLADPGADLAAAVARPRWVVGARDLDRARETVLAEPDAAAPDAEAADAGLPFERLSAFTGMAGHVQVARLRASGAPEAASDPRADGAALTLPPDDAQEVSPA